MKKRYAFPIIIVAIALLFWWLKSGPTTKMLPREPVQSRLDATHVQQNLPANSSNELNFSGSITESNQVATQRDQMNQDREKGLDEWRTPIEFYGKVVDEKGMPVVGAQIEFGCNDLSVEGTSNYQTTSDSEGLFSLRGVTGKLLSVNVSKGGYYPSKRDNRFFYYAGENVNFVPDNKNPVVFHFRKMVKAAPLIVTSYPSFAQIDQLKRDGTPVEIDLLKGAKASAGSGQLKLEFWRDTPEQGVKIFNWKFRVSVPDGGLLATDEEFNYEAAPSGYEPFLEIEMLSSQEKWLNEVRRNYYVRLPNGKYGRIEIYLLARNGVFTIQSFVNPSGSRNLEYDEAVQPKPTVHE